MSTWWALQNAPKVDRNFYGPRTEPKPLVIRENYIHPCGREYFAEDLKNESIHTCLRCNTEFTNPFYQAPKPEKNSMYNKICRKITSTFRSNTHFERIHVE